MCDLLVFWYWRNLLLRWLVNFKWWMVLFRLLKVVNIWYGLLGFSELSVISWWVVVLLVMVCLRLLREILDFVLVLIEVFDLFFELELFSEFGFVVFDFVVVFFLLFFELWLWLLFFLFFLGFGLFLFGFKLGDLFGIWFVLLLDGDLLDGELFVLLLLDWLLLDWLLFGWLLFGWLVLLIGELLLFCLVILLFWFCLFWFCCIEVKNVCFRMNSKM